MKPIPPLSGILLVMGAVFASAAAAQQPPARPPAGVSVDETRTVDQRTALTGPCIVLRAEWREVDVLLARRDFEPLLPEAEGVAAPSASASEPPSAAKAVQARRAQALLRALQPVPGSEPHGCAEQAPLRGQELQSLALEALESGRAVVRDRRSGALVPQVLVRYFGSRCGPLCGRGLITVRTPDGEGPFLIVSWWVS
jgi:hypothetical protein